VHRCRARTALLLQIDIQFTDFVNRFSTALPQVPINPLEEFSVVTLKNTYIAAAVVLNNQIALVFSTDL
jgi:hypothetical protein